MPEPPISESFDTFADELLAERNARPLIIVAASKADDLLLDALRTFLLPKTAKPREQDELLEGDRPLGTFSARIRICRRLGIIDKTLYETLDTLRGLRNLSAHAVSFDATQSPARDYVAELRKRIANRSSYRLTKRTYFDSAALRPIEELQCLLLTLCVLLQVIRQTITTTAGNKGALNIAAK